MKLYMCVWLTDYDSENFLNKLNYVQINNLWKYYANTIHDRVVIWIYPKG